ncbi:MAG: helix-turn-helix domain-containing protein [Limnochordales bacterium]
MENSSNAREIRTIRIRDAARMLHKSESWVYAVAKKRRIKHYRLEGSILLDEDDFYRYIRENTVEAER